MRLSSLCLAICLGGVCAAAGLTPAPAQAQSAAPIIAALSPLVGAQGAQGALDRAHRAKGLAALNESLTNESAADIGFSLVLADSMVSGLTGTLSRTLTPQDAARQQGLEKAFQDKVAALLDRYSVNKKTLDASNKSGALPPGLIGRGHQFLADAVALSDAYEKTHASSKNIPLSAQMGKNDLPAPGACDFHVLSPTRVQIVPRRDPKSPIEARLEDGQWRLDLGKMGAGSSASSAPKIETITPQAAAFLKAIEDKDPSVVEQKLKVDPALANAPPAFYHGRSGSVSQIPLSEAAFENDEQISVLLIKYGANVNAEDDFKGTALDRAARFSSKGVAALLLAHGARIGHRDAMGRTALHEAVEGDDPGTVALLLAHGADVNARDQDGKTPLAVALAFPDPSADHAAILKLLRRHGAKK